jgi:REP element-mobilizing transposase RayT
MYSVCAVLSDDHDMRLFKMANRESAGRATRARGEKRGPAQLRLLGVPHRPPKNGNRHGGRREGAGRKPKVPRRPGVPHRRRAAHVKRAPVHVTLRLVDGLPTLRRRKGYQLAQRAMLVANRFEDARLCHMSIQRNHLHLIVEADDQAALRRAMKSFEISFSKNLNAALGRRGRGHRVFADRYHVERLGTPAQVRAALAYVLGNWRKHGEDHDAPGVRRPMDRYSTAPYFDGWDTGTPELIRFDELPFPEDGALPIRFPKSWLLRIGWKRHGLISPWDRPGPRPAPPLRSGAER